VQTAVQTPVLVLQLPVAQSASDAHAAQSAAEPVGGLQVQERVATLQ
jgi:hypothetical protein